MTGELAQDEIYELPGFDHFDGVNLKWGYYPRVEAKWWERTYVGGGRVRLSALGWTGVMLLSPL